MKIYYSTASPFVRKCLVVAHERGFAERIEHLPQAAHPIYRNDINLLSDNPLGQLPTFVCDDGQVLYDSRVICEYLDSLPAGSRLIPEDGPERWDCLTAQSLADGMTGAALLARYEKLMRPESLQWPVWADAQLQKVQSGLVWLDRAAPNFGGHVDLGKIAFACTLAHRRASSSTLVFSVQRAGFHEGDGLPGTFHTLVRQPQAAAGISRLKTGGVEPSLRWAHSSRRSSHRLPPVCGR